MQGPRWFGDRVCTRAARADQSCQAEQQRPGNEYQRDCDSEQLSALLHE